MVLQESRFGSVVGLQQQKPQPLTAGVGELTILKGLVVIQENGPPQREMLQD
jgi:hypothetical protein